MDINECCKNKSLFNVFMAVLSVFVAVLIVSYIVDIRDKVQETKNTITVSDTGTQYAAPDLAVVTFSVTNEAKTVAEAMKENTDKMNAVVVSVASNGVEEKDRKTTNFSIYPRYEWQDISAIYPEGKRVFVGYEVSQSLEVKIRDLAKTGDIIEAATNAGANNVSDLQFTVDKQDEIKKQAREEAITKAKTKAEELAKQLGVRLVRISSFSEGNSYPYYASYKEAAGLGGGDVSSPVPDIQTGQNKIEVTVSITYEIK